MKLLVILILAFISILALIVWFNYRSLKQQNARQEQERLQRERTLRIARDQRSAKISNYKRELEHRKSDTATDAMNAITLHSALHSHSSHDSDDSYKYRGTESTEHRDYRGSSTNGFSGSGASGSWSNDSGSSCSGSSSSSCD